MDLFAHLPFSILRSSEASDHRKLASGEPLRRVVEVPYMKSLKVTPTSADRTRWIHESQVSIHISIVDQNCWTAYGFEDTYYKMGKEAGRFAESLRETALNCFDALAGPVDSGRLCSTLIKDPFEYFLRLYEIHIEKAQIAWATVVEELEKVIKE